MKKIWFLIDGHKADIGFVVFGLYSILIAAFEPLKSVLPPEVVYPIIGAWTGVAMRDAFRKIE